MLAVLKLPATTPGGVLTVDASLSLHATPHGRRHQRQRPVWTQGRPFLRQRRFSAFHGLRPHRLHHGVYAGGTRQPAVDCSPSETENAPLKSSSCFSNNYLTICQKVALTFEKNKETLDYLRGKDYNRPEVSTPEYKQKVVEGGEEEREWREERREGKGGGRMKWAIGKER